MHMFSESLDFERNLLGDTDSTYSEFPFDFSQNHQSLVIGQLIWQLNEQQSYLDIWIQDFFFSFSANDAFTDVFLDQGLILPIIFHWLLKF